jgi:hypothetical protein
MSALAPLQDKAWLDADALSMAVHALSTPGAGQKVSARKVLMAGMVTGSTDLKQICLHLGWKHQQSIVLPADIYQSKVHSWSANASCAMPLGRH